MIREELKVFLEHLLRIVPPAGVSEVFVDGPPLVDRLLSSLVVQIVIDKELVGDQQLLKQVFIAFDVPGDDAVGLEDQPARSGQGAPAGIAVDPADPNPVLEHLGRAG